MNNKQVNNQPSRYIRHSGTSVFVILVQFNNSDDVISCLKSLKEQTFTDFKTIIVDNASNQGHIDNITSYINSQISNDFKVEFLKNSKNLGYSGGNNIGIKYALEQDVNYVLILNPDTIMEKGALSKMVAVGDNDKKIGIVGSVINEGGKKVAGGKIEWLKPELKHINVNSLDKSTGTGGGNVFENESGSKMFPRRSHAHGKNFFLTGACLLVKREVFEKIGLFDERYFLYFEDADLCIRARKLGYKLVIAETAMIHHQVSATTSKLGVARLLRYHYRNAHTFNMKNAPLWAFVLLPFWSIEIIIKQLIKLVIGREKLISKEILLGVIDFYRGNFGKIS